MPAVVSDSSPLVYLTRLGEFELLHRLYESVLVPEAVWREVAVDGRGLPESDSLRAAIETGWIKVERPSGSWDEAGLPRGHLGPGEIEAMLLARERGLPLIVDETEGREAARRLGLQTTGTLGVLVRAKEHGLIANVRPYVDRLRAETNFRISRAVYDHILSLAGETTGGG